MALNRAHPTMDLDYPEFNETEGEKLAVIVNPASAEKFLAGSGHTFEEIAALGKDRKPLPHFPLAVSLAAKTRVEVTKIESANLVAKLPGSDPALKDEYVVLSAHLDHIGIGEPINGDRIYNGAMDNAAGVATELDVADALHASGAKPRRSLLFLVPTGEEKGLLGSKYYAAHPTVPIQQIVADLNIDMYLPIYPLKRLIVYGLEESDLGPLLKSVAASEGVEVQPDPAPERNVFIRSDQYSFIKKGIPSIFFSFGYTKGSPEEAAVKQWLTHRYHAPSDDTQQPVDLQAAAKYSEIVLRLAEAMADAAKRPQWNANSFFRRYAK
jgi:Zn-dependent M28 family amino/carboxypeptidase